MIEAADPVTLALTGRLPFILLLAAVLTWPVSLGLLRLYTRAVRRSMGSRARTIPPAAGHPAVQAQGTVSGPSLQAAAPQPGRRPRFTTFLCPRSVPKQRFCSAG